MIPATESDAFCGWCHWKGWLGFGWMKEAEIFVLIWTYLYLPYCRLWQTCNCYLSYEYLLMWLRNVAVVLVDRRDHFCFSFVSKICVKYDCRKNLASPQVNVISTEMNQLTLQVHLPLELFSEDLWVSGIYVSWIQFSLNHVMTSGKWHSEWGILYFGFVALFSSALCPWPVKRFWAHKGSLPFKGTQRNPILMSVIICSMSGEVRCQACWDVPGTGEGWSWELGTVKASAVRPHCRVNFCVYCSLSVGTELTQALLGQIANPGGQSVGWDTMTTI